MKIVRSWGLCGRSVSQDNGGEYGRVGAAWLRWQLLHEEGPDGKGMFASADCGLCKTEWVIQKKNMD